MLDDAEREFRDALSRPQEAAMARKLLQNLSTFATLILEFPSVARFVPHSPRIDSTEYRGRLEP
jgi:hypothetical protein